jgi:Aminoglycoside-2''-adenylyltransferase
MSESEQLDALARLHELLERHGIPYWLFGGWAVDFHAGAVTRPHADLDVAIWLEDHARVGELLAAGGWRHAPEPGEDGSTGYERGAVRLELAFLARDDDGEVYTPLRDGRAGWAGGAFEDDVAELRGVRARVISVRSLRAEKSEARDDEVAAAKDRADLATLAGL